MISPFSHPLYLTTKTVGAHCNLACKYCYYLEKADLYSKEERHVMSDETLERFIQQYIEAQTTPTVLFTWHGGEPLMRPLAFYEKVVRLQAQYAQGRQIDNCIQTNGTLLTPEWAKFLHQHNWLVGISIDGPQEFHDAYRRNRLNRPSWSKVMHAIDLLNRYQVEWNAMAVVNDFNADYPTDFYQFFRNDLDCHYLQFAPIVETRLAPQPDGSKRVEMTDESVTPKQWGTFLCSVFDQWVRRDVGERFVQLFDATLANWMGVTPGVCSLARECGHAGVIEWNGDVYSCDHFVYPEHRLGNIHQHSLYELMYGDQQHAFSRLKEAQLPDCCQSCAWNFACHGECPKNRILDPATGQLATHTYLHHAWGKDMASSPQQNETPRLLNYLCKGYQQFFQHVAPYMDFMKQELQAGRPPSNVMTAFS